MIKINSKTLSDFIKKVTINGNINDGILKFAQDGLTLTVADINKSGAVTGFLKASSFIECAQMNVPIRNMLSLINILGTMNGTIELNRNENVLHIASETNDADIMMADEKYIICGLNDMPSLAHDGGFDLDANIFNTVLKNTKILGTTKIGVYAEVKDDMFYIRTGEGEFDKLTTKTRCDYKNVSAKYGSTFLEFVSVMSGRISLAFNDNYPMLVTSVTPDCIIRWMISPVIDPEDTHDETTSAE